LATWYALEFLGVGVFGLGMVVNARRIIHFIAIVAVAKAVRGLDKCWPRPQFSELFVKDRWSLLILQVIPAGIDMALQKMGASVTLTLAARLGQKQVAAHDLVCQLTSSLIQTAFGVGVGFGILVAQRLGAAQASGAKGMAASGAIAVYSILVIASTILYFSFSAYARFASDDPKVIEQLDTLSVLIPLGFLFAGGMVYLMEILIKQGRVVHVMLSVAPCTWFIGLPISFFLAPNFGLWGIHVGNVIGYSAAHVLCAVHVFRSDWAGIARLAGDRAKLAEV